MNMVNVFLLFIPDTIPQACIILKFHFIAFGDFQPYFSQVETVGKRYAARFSSFYIKVV